MSAPALVPAEVDTLHEGRILRFDRAERWLHRANAVLILTLLATGLVLYVGFLSALVGRRALVKNTHVVAGLLLPVPFLLICVGRWREGFRRDVRRLGRFLTDDWRWLRSRGRAPGLRLGKFNAGQKLNAILVAGTLPVMLLTGSIMYWNEPFSDSWRTGATFVHDWGFVVLLVATTGHIAKALGEPTLRAAIRHGWVPTSWAATHRPRWHDEVVHEPDAQPLPVDPPSSDPVDAVPGTVRPGKRGPSSQESGGAGPAAR